MNPQTTSTCRKARRAAAALAISCAMSCAAMIASGAKAQEHVAGNPFLDPFGGEFNEIETKYIFGFTDGSDIGLEGEKAIELETNAAFRRRTGRYMALEQEVSFEHTPTQFFSYELAVHGTGHRIKDDEFLGDKSIVRAAGLSAKFRYLLLGRGPGSPVGITISAEPEWSRVEGATGTATRSLGATLKFVADAELVQNRLYAALNLIWSPETSKPVGDLSWGRSSTFGASGAVAFRLTPTITVGAEYERYFAFDSYGFGTFQGHADYLGPTLHIQLTRKIQLAAAYSRQVSGHTLADDRPYDLANFTRHRARLKLEYEF